MMERWRVCWWRRVRASLHGGGVPAMRRMNSKLILQCSTSTKTFQFRGLVWLIDVEVAKSYLQAVAYQTIKSWSVHF